MQTAANNKFLLGAFGLVCVALVVATIACVLLASLSSRTCSEEDCASIHKSDHKSVRASAAQAYADFKPPDHLSRCLRACGSACMGSASAHVSERCARACSTACGSEFT